MEELKFKIKFEKKGIEESDILKFRAGDYITDLNNSSYVYKILNIRRKKVTDAEIANFKVRVQYLKGNNLYGNVYDYVHNIEKSGKTVCEIEFITIIRNSKKVKRQTTPNTIANEIEMTGAWTSWYGYKKIDFKNIYTDKQHKINNLKQRKLKLDKMITTAESKIQVFKDLEQEIIAESREK